VFFSCRVHFCTILREHVCRALILGDFDWYCYSTILTSKDVFLVLGVSSTRLQRRSIRHVPALGMFQCPPLDPEILFTLGSRLSLLFGVLPLLAHLSISTYIMLEPQLHMVLLLTLHPTLGRIQLPCLHRYRLGAYTS
jgi:hypothetical protein